MFPNCTSSGNSCTCVLNSELVLTKRVESFCTICSGDDLLMRRVCSAVSCLQINVKLARGQRRFGAL